MSTRQFLIKICIGIIIFWVVSFAQEPNVVWTKTFGGNMGDKAYSVQQTQDGGFIIVGATNSFGAGNRDVYLIKTDPFGNREWQKTFGTAYYDEGWCVQQTTDGEYIITGTYNDDPPSDIYLIKVYPSGAPHWWKAIGTTEYSEWGSWVEQTRDGGYIIVGGQMALEEANVYLVKTDALGNVEWTQDYGGVQSDVGWCVQETDLSDPGYIIAGATSSFGNGRQVWLIKTDEYGNLEWDKRFGWIDWDEARCVRQTFPDGGYILNTVLRYPEGIFMGLIKTDASGNILWGKKLRPTTTSAARGYSVQQTSDGGYIAVGEAMLTDNWDVYIVKVDKDGNVEWQKTIDRAGLDNHGYSVDLIGEDGYIVAGATDEPSRSYDVYLVKLGPQIVDTDDPLALAYNSNRHLARKPNTQELHLVYTREGKIIYQYTSNGGDNWTSPLEIGTGKFPAIALSSNHLPSVAWTDDNGGLWYRRKINETQWSEIYHLYDPWGIWQPRLNSPPSIVITPSVAGDTVHILYTLHIPANGPINQVAEYLFFIQQPFEGSVLYIEGGVGPNAGPIRSFPSITRDYENRLHAVWQRGDTICYAIREVGQTWDNWGWRFRDQGIQSAHPFVECYGDMVYVVWQHQATPGAPEEVYKGWRQLTRRFAWTNFSRTPDTKSLFPVSASGFFTVYVDEIMPYPNCGWEIFYKVHPDDIACNISHTLARSTYPQSVCRFTGANSYLYTAWLDGDNVPYEIRFKKIQYIPMAVAYLTSPNGYETPSPYLIARDSFVSGWQIPVDIGYETITYQFLLEPGYRYKIKAVAYHESSGEWREWIVIDGKMKHLIKYNAYEPETLEFWLPPAYYKDSIVEVVFDRITGDFATGGPIWVYQYEYEEGEGGGPMAQASYSISSASLVLFPNPFREKLNIKYQTQDNDRISFKIYDATGRLVRQIIQPFNHCVWAGEDENGRKVSSGVYFLICENSNTKETVCHKIVKVE